MKYISAGHCNVHGPNYDPGASGVNGRTEAQETVTMRDAVIDKLHSMGVTDIVRDADGESLKQYLGRIKSGNASVVCEFHFNAFNSMATGTEVLIQQDADKMDIACAKELAKFTADTMGIQLHKGGVISELESKRGKLGLMREQGVVVLVEICFIDNHDDMKKYDANFDALASGYASILAKYDSMIS